MFSPNVMGNLKSHIKVQLNFQKVLYTLLRVENFPSQGRQVFTNEDYLHMSGGMFNNNSTGIRKETIPFRLSLSINKDKYKLQL